MNVELSNLEVQMILSLLATVNLTNPDSVVELALNLRKKLNTIEAI